MTVSAASPLVVYTIAGVGPYALPWPFQAGGVSASIVPVGGAIWVPLTGLQFTLSPLAGSDTTGTLVLDAALATAYVGAKLHITRTSLQAQGWDGIANTREVGIEAQLDQMTLLMQELSAAAARALRVTGNAINPAFVTDGCSVVWNEAQRAFLPGPSATDLANAGPNAIAAAASAASAAAIVGGLGSLTAAVTAAQNSAAAAAAAVGAGLLGLVKFREVAASAKTTFTITGGYTVGSEFVYLNGVLLDTSEYTASTGTTVVLGTACAINDEFRLVCYSTFTVSNTLARSSNLADIADLPTARSNLGISTFFQTLLSAASEGVLRGLLLLGWGATAAKSSTLQAQVGTDDTVAMTPATTAAAIAALTPVPAKLSTASGSPPSYAARAWVNFDGATGNINAQGNIASVARTALGTYTVAFTTAMPDANYVVVFGGSNSGFTILNVSSQSVGSFNVTIGNRGSTNVDPTPGMFVIFR